MKHKSPVLPFGFEARITSLVLLVAIFMLVLGISWIYLSAGFVGKSSVDFGNYPSASFKIPEEILKERIATESAFTARIPIVMYHYVEYVDRTKDQTRADLSTAPSTLEKQIFSLKMANYNFLFVRQIPDIVSQKNSVPPRPVVLTFDDGYEDFYFNVMPILKKFQAKATLYVIVDFIGRPGYLDLAELKEIRDSGLVEVASHTLNHTYLKGIKIELAKKEIIESKTKLESLLGISVPSFAYPWGAFSKETLQIVKTAGYTNAVSVIPGVNQSQENEFYLFRIRPGFLSGINPAKSLQLYK
jgi:peptidoglycan/xylan/chitin deacetylase (PgdA/CDA1 family)